MAKRLQEFSFDKSPYERPNQQWVCGWTSEGRPCQLGPNSKGVCRATFECKPWKNEDRWECSRHKSHGGKCKEGPLPNGQCCRPLQKCQPVRSVRAKRKLTVMYTCAVTLAVIAFSLVGDLHSFFIEPGELTTPHSAIAGKLRQEDSEQTSCSLCHTAGSGGVENWLHTASFQYSEMAIAESQLCLDCHYQDRSKHTYEMYAHGISPKELKQRTKRIQESNHPSSPTLLSKLSSQLPSGVSNQEQIACSLCHKEHRGRNYNITQMSNQQCQTCHTVQFASLKQGHPQFHQFPYQKRTNIKFDHLAHIGQDVKDEEGNVIRNTGYFAAGKMMYGVTPPQLCSDCHHLDGDKNMMGVKPFEETCAQCHSMWFNDKQVDVLRMPGVNLDNLKKGAQQLGLAIDSGEFEQHWVSSTEQEDTGKLTPFMKFFLAKELERAEHTEKIHQWLEQELVYDSPSDPANAKEVKAAHELVKILKEFYRNLSEHGHRKLKEHITSTLDEKEFSDTHLSQMVGRLPVGLVKDLHRKVLNNQDVYVSDHRVTDAGGWYQDNFTIKYRPVGHADSFLKTWLDITGKYANKSPAAKQVFKFLREREGSCSKCHSVTEQADGSLVMNWESSPSLQGHFTKFSHTPHLSLLNQTGCQTCHSFKDVASYMQKDKQKYEQSYQSTNPYSFVSNFQFISKGTCTQCHVEDAAGNNCTLCHNYHAKRFAPAIDFTLSGEPHRVEPPQPPVATEEPEKETPEKSEETPEQAQETPEQTEQTEQTQEDKATTEKTVTPEETSEPSEPVSETLSPQQEKRVEFVLTILKDLQQAFQELANPVTTVQAAREKYHNALERLKTVNQTVEVPVLQETYELASAPLQSREDVVGRAEKLGEIIDKFDRSLDLSGIEMSDSQATDSETPSETGDEQKQQRIAYVVNVLAKAKESFEQLANPVTTARDAFEMYKASRSQLQKIQSKVASPVLEKIVKDLVNPRPKSRQDVVDRAEKMQAAIEDFKAHAQQLDLSGVDEMMK